MLIEIITAALVAAFVVALVFPERMRSWFTRDRPDAADALACQSDYLVRLLKARFDAEEVAW